MKKYIMRTFIFSGLLMINTSVVWGGLFSTLNNDIMTGRQQNITQKQQKQQALMAAQKHHDDMVLGVAGLGVLGSAISHSGGNNGGGRRYSSPPPPPVSQDDDN